MRISKFFRLSVIFSAIAVVACVAGFCISLVGNEPLCLLTSIIAIATMLALLFLEISFPPYSTVRKKAKSILIPVTIVALLGDILGLILLEYTVVSKAVLIGTYGVVSLLNVALLLVSLASYNRWSR